MNGAGMTLPAAGTEVAFLPGSSRAEFFYSPLKEAYVYATADLGTELIPVCNKAKTILDTLQREIDSRVQELQQGGNLPATPDACFNMCTQRVDLEEQRGQARQKLAQTVTRLNNEIAEAGAAIESLQASRSEKAGELGRRLSRLQSARQNELSQRAKQLLDEQVAKIRFSIGVRVRHDAGKYVGVVLINGSDYAIVERSGARVAGYYQGAKIIESRISIPRYGGQEVLTDQFGFSKGYLVPPGGRVTIGNESIYDIPGLSVSSPSGRLLAAEKGWTANSKGYILPDEIRIKEFPPDLFVIPDEEGTRTGSSITYNPRKVDFHAEAAARGLPQDAEIARLRQKMGNQSYPEDEQIREQESLIASLNQQKKQASDDFNNSAVASQISQLTSSESSCRSARDSLAALETGRSKLAEIKTDLSSCGSESLDPAAVFSAVAELNRSYDAYIETPDITSRYESKAMALVMSKITENLEKTSLSRIDGGYSLAEGVDPKSTLALVNWRSGFGESFWFQPLDSLGDRKDLTYVTAEDGSFEDYIERVISFGLGTNSLDELSLRFAVVGLEAHSPYAMQAQFKVLVESAAANVEAIEAAASIETAEEGEVPAEAPLSCEP